MSRELQPLTDSQQERVNELEETMKHMFLVFFRLDEEGVPITDALERIGMEVPLFARPAINQLSGKFKDMRKEESSS